MAETSILLENSGDSKPPIPLQAEPPIPLQMEPLFLGKFVMQN